MYEISIAKLKSFAEEQACLILSEGRSIKLAASLGEHGTLVFSLFALWS